MADNDRKEVDLKRIAKQPVFKRQEDAVEYAMKKMASGDGYPEIWQEPDGGKFVSANDEAFEALYRHGYRKILDARIILEMLNNEKQIG